MNIWFLTTATLLAGISIGALGFAAVERHVRTAKTEDSQYDRAAVSPQQPPPVRGGLQRDDVAGTSPSGYAGDATDRWETTDRALSKLGQRVTELEMQVSKMSANQASTSILSAQTERAARGGLDRETLVAAGVDTAVATEYLNRQSRLEMQRLELRDRASREGWVNSDRFIEKLGELEGDVGSLREEIGDDSYDRFLYLTGQPNRVVIASVIDESPAQLAGVQAGDIVLNYADSRVFSFTELRDATRVGERGENVLLRVQRQGETMELILPRGPLGVRLDADRVEPAENS